MDLATPGFFNNCEIIGINLYRLHFNALLLSNITNAAVSHILPGILDGTMLVSQSKPRGPKVKQLSSDVRAWKAWRKLLRQISDFYDCPHSWSMVHLRPRPPP
jgi:hypothetical protein